MGGWRVGAARVTFGLATSMMVRWIRAFNGSTNAQSSFGTTPPSGARHHGSCSSSWSPPPSLGPPPIGSGSLRHSSILQTRKSNHSWIDAPSAPSQRSLCFRWFVTRCSSRLETRSMSTTLYRLITTHFSRLGLSLASTRW